jgi:hypothetical protein
MVQYITAPGSSGGGMAIGGAVTSGTAGSILYVGTGAVLAQNNAVLYISPTTGYVTIGISNGTTPAFPLTVVVDNPLGTLVGMLVTDQAAAGYGGTLGILNVFSHYASVSGGQALLSVGSNNQNNQLIITDLTATTFRFGIAPGGLGVGVVSINKYEIFGASTYNAIQFNDVAATTLAMTFSTFPTGNADMIFQPGLVTCLTLKQSTNTILIAKSVSSYNAVSTAGAGLIPIYANGNITAQTTAQTICTYTPAVTGTFQIGSYMNITALALDVAQLQVSYTDENSNATTQVIPLVASGSAVAAFTFTATATGNNVGQSITIRASAAAITLKVVLTTSTGSITYDAGGYIAQPSLA